MPGLGWAGLGWSWPSVWMQSCFQSVTGPRPATVSGQVMGGASFMYAHGRHHPWMQRWHTQPPSQILLFGAKPDDYVLSGRDTCVGRDHVSSAVPPSSGLRVQWYAAWSIVSSFYISHQQNMCTAQSSSAQRCSAQPSPAQPRLRVSINMTDDGTRNSFASSTICRNYSPNLPHYHG